MGEPEEKENQKIDELLGKPIFADLPEETLKTRRNLIVFSSLGLGIVVHDLSINGGNFSGLGITGLTNDVVLSSLFFVTLYLLIHFWFQVFDYFGEWRLRITGSKVEHITTGRFAAEELDYPNDPRQSTLYNWWKERKSLELNPDYVIERSQNLTNNLHELRAKMEQKKDDDTDFTKESGLLLKYINEFEKFIRDLKNSPQETNKILNNRRLERSLQRFDKCFFQFQFSQLARLYLLEVGVPILLGLWTVWFTSPYSPILSGAIVFVAAALPFFAQRILKWLSQI